MFSHHVVHSLHCSYYGPGAVLEVEDPDPPVNQRRGSRALAEVIGVGSLRTDTEIEKMIGPVGRNDLMGATARGVGAYLRLIYSAEEPFIGDLTPMPQRLADLLRRAA
jgi:hypothetical protein